MRIIVGDIEKYVRAYAAGDTAFFDRLRHLGGAVTPLTTKAMVCNQTFRLGGVNKFAWDFETLEQAALTNGFSQVARSTINDAPPDLAIDGQDWWRPFEALRQPSKVTPPTTRCLRAKPAPFHFDRSLEEAQIEAAPDFMFCLGRSSTPIHIIFNTQCYTRSYRSTGFSIFERTDPNRPASEPP
jgi:hypothetical protein